jgi:hypothetical protein
VKPHRFDAVCHTNATAVHSAPNVLTAPCQRLNASVLGHGLLTVPHGPTEGPPWRSVDEKSGLPQSHISRLERARHRPSRATVEKIARALGRLVSDFDPSAD